MEFGKHIGKGLWAFADKSLPAIYGIGFIFLVIRVLPEREYGSYVLVQNIFNIATAFGFALALQPLTKFAAGIKEHGPHIVASIVVLTLFYGIVSILVVIFHSPLTALLDESGEGNLAILLNYLPLMFLTALYRSFAVSLLQASYQVRKIFWIDAVYFLGSLLLIYSAQNIKYVITAVDVIMLNIIASACSTILAIVLTYKEMSVQLSMQKEVFQTMWNFGKYTFGGNAMYTIFSQMDVFFISSFVGVTAVAVYSAAKIFTRIYDVVAQVLQMFLIPFSSKMYSQGEREKLQHTAEKSVCFSSLILLPVFIVLFFFPELVLQLFYSGRYDHSANILRVLSFLALIVPWNGVISSYLIGTGKVKEGFYFSIIFVVIAVALYWLLTPWLGALGTSMGLIISLVAITLFLLWYLQRIIPLKVFNVVKRVQDVVMFLKTKGGSA